MSENNEVMVTIARSSAEILCCNRLNGKNCSY